MLQKLKKHLKYTKYYQSKCAEFYFSRRKKRLECLPKEDGFNDRYISYLVKGKKVNQFCDIISHIQVTLKKDSRFQSWIDTGIYAYNFGILPHNTSPNYELILNCSIMELLKKSKQYNNEVADNNVQLLLAVKTYIERITKEFDKVCQQIDSAQLRQSRTYFMRMIEHKAESLEEALQRIIFWSSLFWQSGHLLMGLGRLDKVLERFEIPQNPKEAKDMIADFYDEMHRYYAFKSGPVAMGDTGQIVVLGGIEPNGKYFANDYTYFFIDVLLNHNLPDPKILLRVSEIMPKDLLELAIQCIATGVGCHLLANDDVIIPALEDFGYKKDDAHNYVTSACWEPLIYGKSLEINNIKDLNYADAFVLTYQDENFEKCKSFNELLDLYYQKLTIKINEIKYVLDNVVWEEDPLLSLFTEGCLKKGKDISKGGAIYNNYGILTVGLGNAVNSLLYIKHCVFGKEEHTLKELKNCLLNNYQGFEELLDEVSGSSNYYGKDEDEVIDIVKIITKQVYDALKGYKNKFGGKVKWGLSSSNYLENGKITGTTLDGRLSGSALTTHISGKGGVGYTELVNFASQMDYSGHRANGNVVDFFVTPEFLEQNLSKFALFILGSIRQGFFEIQMNVVSSKVLIEAKENPKDFPDLIVRVWGFSAYFVELPAEYQEVLINRALQSEGKELLKLA